MEQSQRTLIKQLETNLRKAGSHTVRVIDYLKSKGMTPLSAHLKPDTLYHMEVLITVTEKDFLSDTITDVYDYLCTIEEGGSDDLYRISFHIADAGEHFDESLLESDGYAFKRDVSNDNKKPEQVT